MPTIEKTLTFDSGAQISDTDLAKREARKVVLSDKMFIDYADKPETEWPPTVQAFIDFRAELTVGNADAMQALRDANKGTVPFEDYALQFRSFLYEAVAAAGGTLEKRIVIEPGSVSVSNIRGQRQSSGDQVPNGGKGVITTYYTDKNVVDASQLLQDQITVFMAMGNAGPDLPSVKDFLVSQGAYATHGATESNYGATNVFGMKSVKQWASKWREANDNPVAPLLGEAAQADKPGEAARAAVLAYIEAGKEAEKAA